MSSLDAIGIRIENGERDQLSAGNALPILNEIRHALDRLTRNGAPTVIDLLSMPFGPGDEERLLSVLGKGEVSAVLDSLGESRAWESRFPGVWLVDHYGPDGQRVAFHIEITDMPQILRAQHEDIAAGLQQLNSVLGDSEGLATESGG